MCSTSQTFNHINFFFLRTPINIIRKRLYKGRGGNVLLDAKEGGSAHTEHLLLADAILNVST